MDEFDGFDPKTIYQMVPTGQDRSMSVVTDADACVITVDPVNIARMHNFHFDHGVPDQPGDFRAVLTPNNRMTFEISGQRKGNTNITLSKENGIQINTLTVSVKDKITKTYNTCRLSDIRRTCPFSAANITAIMPKVEATFIQQANAELKQKEAGQVFDIIVPRDLGIPLFADKTDVRFAIIDATGARHPPFILAADFIVYFTWDLRAFRPPKEIVGLTVGRLCFVEFQNDEFQNALTTAHELGHALGLNHTGAKFLMAGDGDSRSSKLQQFEIDMINKTDTNTPIP